MLLFSTSEIELKGLQQLQEIHDIKNDAWTDFMDHKLDHEALLRQLEASAPGIMAVSNIAYGKTILERHAVDSLNNRSLNNRAEDDVLDWLCLSATRPEDALRSRLWVWKVSLSKRAIELS
ncbi:hypothetical protein MPDQ_002251 [Monascus purpureus]|uniref:Uncharacterized protein n=1 Tax=Monascus purpureus TaxID=5098 RepID=A0A507R471_MONPU|nr:hypothetical protein MPDQ_002251 [Monascus purpureus]BDD59963.1 hypothetical protein MAP00_005130 [Monascus purpureus]